MTTGLDALNKFYHLHRERITVTAIIFSVELVAERVKSNQVTILAKEIKHNIINSTRT